MSSAKRAMVTGATGFVGANLARRLLAEGHDVHLLVRPGHNPWRIAAILGDVHLHELPLADLEPLTSGVARIRPDWVFHLAAHGAYSWQTDVQEMVQTNVTGTVNLVEACLRAGFEAFVSTGSSSEYGFKDHAPCETDWLEPNSSYAVTKAAATLFCRHIARNRDVHLTTLRLYSVYGPFEEPARLIPTLIARGVAGELPSLANPETARDYVYVDDAVEAYLLAAAGVDEEPGAVYNVGTGTQTSLRQVVDVARRALGIAAEPNWGTMPDRQWDSAVWVADGRKLRRELRWEPRYTFERGFEAMLAWIRHNPTEARHYRQC
jgi:UDP-glucose 4-epimerase